MTTALAGRLTGKIAAITGIGSGQGRTAALRFAAEGATVFGCDVDAAAATRTAQLTDDAVHATAVDVTDDDAVREWFGSIEQAAGRLDILYANAGWTAFAPIEDLDLPQWRTLLTAEVDVTFLPVRHAWPLLRRSESASVILVGSTAGVTGSVSNPRLAHTAAKGAVIAMTKQLAAEGAPHGIRSNCISPGMVVTAQSEATLLAPDHPMHDIAEAIPLRRLGTADDVVNYAVFLASDESGYVTGTNLMIDGGWSAVLPS